MRTGETRIVYYAFVDEGDRTQGYIGEGWNDLIRELPAPFAGFSYERPTTEKELTDSTTEEGRPIKFCIAHMLSMSIH